jgi:hypothetical protein
MSCYAPSLCAFAAVSFAPIKQKTRIKKMKQFLKTTAVCLAMTLLCVCLLCTSVLADTQKQTIVGYGYAGEGTGKQTPVVDFENTNLDGFFPYDGTEPLNFETSGALGTRVLKTPLAGPNTEKGITKTFADASIFNNVSTVSIYTVVNKKDLTYRITLRLSGVDKNDAPLAFEAHANSASNEWQALTFDVSAFVEQVNTAKPVTLTFLACSTSTETNDTDWMIKSIYVSTPETLPEYLLPTAAAVCGFAVGFAFFFVIYRTTCNKKRRAH